MVNAHGASKRIHVIKLLALYPQSECAEWIHTATILIEDLKSLDPNYVPVVPATPMTGDAKSETATTTPAPTPQVVDGAEVRLKLQLPIFFMLLSCGLDAY